MIDYIKLILGLLVFALLIVFVVWSGLMFGKLLFWIGTETFVDQLIQNYL